MAELSVSVLCGGEREEDVNISVGIIHVLY